jgi:hypothetical protein
MMQSILDREINQILQELLTFLMIAIAKQPLARLLHRIISILVFYIQILIHQVRRSVNDQQLNREQA